MACYVLRCKCGNEIEKITSYEKAKALTCACCNEVMEIVPSRSRFKIEGYSALNNYSCPEFGYDGQDKTW